MRAWSSGLDLAVCPIWEGKAARPTAEAGAGALGWPPKQPERQLQVTLENPVGRRGGGAGWVQHRAGLGHPWHAGQPKAGRLRHINVRAFGKTAKIGHTAVLQTTGNNHQCHRQPAGQPNKTQPSDPSSSQSWLIAPWNAGNTGRTGSGAAKRPLTGRSCGATCATPTPFRGVLQPTPKTEDGFEIDFRSSASMLQTIIGGLVRWIAGMRRMQTEVW